MKNRSVDDVNGSHRPAWRLTVLEMLRASSLFEGVSVHALDEIAKDVDRVELASGDVLFRSGDHGDSFYMVVHGRLRVLATGDSGREVVVRELGRGENVGELALLTGNRRSATVQAIRDTILARLSCGSLFRAAEAHPSIMIQLTRMLASWVARTNNPSAKPSSAVVSLAVVPHDPAVPADEFCDKLAQALAHFGRTAVLRASIVEAALGQGAAQLGDHDRGRDMLANWLDAHEAHFRFLIYQADPEPSGWSRRCVRQADRVLYVAAGDERPVPGPSKCAIERLGRPPIAREELVLLRNSDKPRHTFEWRALGNFSRHHHLQLTRPSDLARLARHLAGRALGLALGGGGARGFAHIGVIRALEEAGIPIDRIGGSSMGAVIAAQYAQGLGYSEMLSMNREHWIGVQPSRDLTFPLIALLSGRKGTRMLEWMFGDTCIEDLPLNYYCTSTNLTRAEPMVHREGLLRDWIRASISIPGIAPPFVTQSGELLVDGALLNTVPVDAIHHPDEGIVIAVDVSGRANLSASGHKGGLPSPWRALWQSFRCAAAAPKFPNIFSIIQRTAHLGAMQLSKGLKDRVDLYLEPPVRHWDLFDWNALDTIAECGYQSTRQTIEAWKARAVNEPGLLRTERRGGGEETWSAPDPCLLGAS